MIANQEKGMALHRFRLHPTDSVRIHGMLQERVVQGVHTKESV